MKCEGCPVPGRCIGEADGWAFACWTKDRSIAGRTFVVNRSAVEDGSLVVPPPAHVPSRPDMGAAIEGPSAPAPSFRVNDQFRASASDPPPRPTLPLSVSMKALKIGHGNCLYATRCGCAGGGAFCHHLKRVVSLHDCVDCLTSTGTLRPE